MAETTQLNKIRQKRLRHSASKLKEDQAINSYFYPKNNLYTRQEFELLDTIYSDEPPTGANLAEKAVELENFWPQNKEELMTSSNQKSSLFNNLLWFVSGVMLTSVVWLIYFQFKVSEIRTKGDTQIVFQKTAALMTDKTVDKEVSSKLGNKSTAEEKAKGEVAAKKSIFSDWFISKPKSKPLAESPAIKQEQPVNIAPVGFHVVSSGDSLWTIANKYYSNPSPENINKIMKANKMRRIGILSVGQKLVIPN